MLRLTFHAPRTVRAALHPSSEEGSVPVALAGFTLVELLVVVAIIGILAALILPTLSRAGSQGKRVSCQNRLRQLAVCAQMYAADNNGKLAENGPGEQREHNWVFGNMKAFQDATNRVWLQESKFFPYAPHVDLFRCPADPSVVRGISRVRSYSMNGWVGGRSMQTAQRQSSFRTFLGETELAAIGPSIIWVLIDEHEASIDDSFFLVTMDDRRPFASFPANRHGGGYSLNFADGHVEAYKLRDPESQSFGVEGARFSPRNIDWIRLKLVSTSK